MNDNAFKGALRGAIGCKRGVMLSLLDWHWPRVEIPDRGTRVRLQHRFISRPPGPAKRGNNLSLREAHTGEHFAQPELHRFRQEIMAREHARDGDIRDEAQEMAFDALCFLAHAV